MEDLASLTAKERLFQTGLERMRLHFDSELALVEQRTDVGVFHPPRGALTYAHALLQTEGDTALPTIERIIRCVLTTQERQAGNIHYGNFKWMYEDQGVTDLNAIQFVLEQLLPLYMDCGDRLSLELRAEILEAVRLGAIELENLNVHPSYTNITLLDTLNTVLAGQILGDERLLSRGGRRLDEWIELTNHSGTVQEYNSPTYCGVDLGALAELAERAQNPEVATKAQLMEERLWLHVATHYHHPSAQLAGPHSRAYHNDVTGGIGWVKLILYRYLNDERLLVVSSCCPERQIPGNVRVARQSYHLPDYIQRLLANKPYPYTVQETADVENGVDLYTYMMPTYALGTVSASDGRQSDRLILHYRKEKDPGYGILYSRYIVNEKVLGSYFHTSGRSRATNLNEEGQFWGLQHENKAIAIYALQPQYEPVHSLKTEVFVLGYQGLDEVWVNGERVEKLPRELKPLDALLIADADTFIAVRPLEPSNLGRSAPIILQARDEDLVLSIYNYYQGEEKRFWEYASLSGAFYKGNIRAGFIIEVGDREKFGDFAAFRAHIARSFITDQTEGHVRWVGYASGGDLMKIGVDLYANRLVGRRVNGVDYCAPMLSSPTVVQSASGELCVGGAKLRTSSVPAWLLADNAHDCWVATNLTDQPVFWYLETPVGTVTSAAFGFGRVVWRGRDQVEIEVLSARQLAPLRIQAGDRPVRMKWNGEDVTSECTLDQRTQEHILPIGPRITNIERKGRTR